MYPSCVVDDYAVSKTFLILYRNEEIILDDQILFKVSTLVNAFNLVESFEKMDLQLNIELWFTENDFKPTPTTSVSDDPSVINKDSQAANNASSLSIASSSSSTGAGVVQFTNLNNLNGGKTDKLSNKWEIYGKFAKYLKKLYLFLNPNVPLTFFKSKTHPNRFIYR